MILSFWDTLNLWHEYIKTSVNSVYPVCWILHYKAAIIDLILCDTDYNIIDNLRYLFTTLSILHGIHEWIAEDKKN